MFNHPFKILAIALTFLALSHPGFAETGISDRFSDYDPDSETTINHEPLTGYLNDTVFLIGRSKRFLGAKKAELFRASKIKLGMPTSPSRYEGGRLFIHAFSADHVHFFTAYQQGLENLSQRRSISAFNKNEQLAFWLNLYNVVVINKMVEDYPRSNLRYLREPGKDSFWNQKVTTIEGVPLSLTDIEEILFENFNSPLVAFGLWQGAIGGPRLLNYAYTGENVWKALEENAIEFVNSNRGLRPPKGDKLKVSKFYDWMRDAFGSSDDHVLMFIKAYADPNFISGVSAVTTINANLYDWAPSDLLGGNLHEGQYNQMGGLLQQHGSGGLNSRGGVFNRYLNYYSNTHRPDGSFEFSAGKVPLGGTLNRFPAQFWEFVKGVQVNNEVGKVPVITTRECAPDDPCDPNS